LLPPLIFLSSPAGGGGGKLRISSGHAELRTNSIKFYAGRLAIGFDWSDDQSLIKLIDVKGSSIADYEVKESAGDLDPILACYGPEGFTLIPRGAETKLHLVKVKLP